MRPVTLESWLVAHPFLRLLAQFTARVDRAASEIETPRVRIPAWDDYVTDFQAGVPVLVSSAAGVDLAPAKAMAKALAERLTSDPPGEPGLARYLESVCTARYLAPVVEAFAAWRDEERWLRPYCPACGSPPAMAQLTAEETGRVRWLSCGLCRSRWRFARTLCPFCGHDAHRAAAMTIQGEEGLRIDHCTSCKGYLKTYDGQGEEGVLLADWTTLHLDVAACERGLARKGASLYELGTLLPARA